MLEATPERLLESESRPLDDHVIDFLIDHDKEEPYLDFKEIISIAKDYPFSELAKDFLAFLNYGGGWVLLGFRDKSRSPVEEDKNWNRQYVPVGLRARARPSGVRPVVQVSFARPNRRAGGIRP